MSDLQKAFQHFKDVYLRYCAYFDYYDGDQPLRYSTERLKDAFQQIRPKFRENVCGVVIDTVNDRLELYGWNAPDDNVTALLSDVWTETGLALEADEVHQSALICGESFLVGWKDDDRPLEFYYNDPRRAACFYDEDHPKEKSFAAKWWDADDGCHMILYYADRLERYVAPKKKMAELREDDNGRSFVLEADGVSVNPYGIIPVFHFRNTLRKRQSDLKSITEIQDAINKLFCDMMVTAEFSAFPARYVISSADIETLRNAPNQIWDLPAGLEGQQNTQVGTLEAANLNNYSNEINELISAVSFISHVPKHYFERTGANVSGEALVTMESALVKKVNRKRELFGDTWQDVAVFALRVLGIDYQKRNIQPQWGNAEADQPLTETQIIMNWRSAGLPLRSALRLSGYTDAEIDIIEQEIAEEKQAQSDLAQLYLETARNRSAQENNI